MGKKSPFDDSTRVFGNGGLPGEVRTGPTELRTKEFEKSIEVTSEDLEAEAVWYVDLHGRTQGPMRRSHVVKLIEEHRIGTTTYVWHPRFTHWQHLSTVVEFAEIMLSAVTGRQKSKAAETLQKKASWEEHPTQVVIDADLDDLGGVSTEDPSTEGPTKEDLLVEQDPRVGYRSPPPLPSDSSKADVSTPTTEGWDRTATGLNGRPQQGGRSFSPGGEWWDTSRHAVLPAPTVRHEPDEADLPREVSADTKPWERLAEKPEQLALVSVAKEEISLSEILPLTPLSSSKNNGEDAEKEGALEAAPKAASQLAGLAQGEPNKARGPKRPKRFGVWVVALMVGGAVVVVTLVIGVVYPLFTSDRPTNSKGAAGDIPVTFSVEKRAETPSDSGSSAGVKEDRAENRPKESRNISISNISTGKSKTERTVETETKGTVVRLRRPAKRARVTPAPRQKARAPREREEKPRGAPAGQAQDEEAALDQLVKEEENLGRRQPRASTSRTRKPSAWKEAEERQQLPNEWEGENEAAAREKLTPADIRTTMRELRPTVHACFERYREPGTVSLQVTVEPNGRAGASVVGDFRGSETASCVVDGVKRLQFPTFAGGPITFVYPFRLRAN